MHAPLVKSQVGDRPERPPWASLDFDVDKWWDLAQMSQTGKYEALDLLTKLQHKAHKNELTDANRWLHSSTSKARSRLS